MGHPLTVLAMSAGLLAACAAGPSGGGGGSWEPGRPTAPAAPATAPPVTPSTATTGPGGVPEARQGRPAASQRRTFAPTRIRVTTSGARSELVRVLRVDTDVDGSLQLPARAGEVGWWASGALAGEAFGSVVLAGHVDSRLDGLGFFARLLDARAGDRVELSDGQLLQHYVVRSRTEVAKDVLSGTAGIFTGSGPSRLVLITCTGRFDPRTRHYDRNLVVVAEPLGVAQHLGS